MRLEQRSGRLLSHHVRDVLVRVDIAESDDFALNTFLKKANLDCDVLQGFMSVIVSSSNCQCSCVVYPHNRAVNVSFPRLTKV